MVGHGNCHLGCFTCWAIWLLPMTYCCDWLIRESDWNIAKWLIWPSLENDVDSSLDSITMMTDSVSPVHPPSHWVNLLSFFCCLPPRQCTGSDCMMEYLLTSAITSLYLLLFSALCALPFSVLRMSDQDFALLSHSLIRPWSRILILAEVKTPDAIKIGWQLIFLGGLQ